MLDNNIVGGMRMNREIVNEQQAQAIVDGILQGYKDYLEIRRQKKEELKVSASYAFVKGNHIDDAVSRKLTGLIEKDQLAKAGESWEYLQFAFGRKDNKCLFIVKNILRLKRTFQTSHKKSQYLVDLAKVNNPWIQELRQGRVKKEGVSIQLQFLDFEKWEQTEEIRERNFSEFYIVTYETDSHTKEIISVEIVAPDAETGELHSVQKLSSYLQSSDVIIQENEYESISGEVEFGSVEDYGYTTLPEEGEEIGN